MSRRFVIGANPLADAEKEAIRTWLGGNYAWWSWIDGFWLIKDSYNTLTAEAIRDKFHKLAPNAHIIVLQSSSGGDWTGYGPASPENPKLNMFNWLQNTWDHD